MFSKYIDKERLVGDIRDAVKIQSVVTEPQGDMPFGKNVAEALKYCLDISQRMGFRTVNLDNKVGYAEYGEGDEMIAVLGHIDVVPAGDGWMSDPFGGDIIDGKMYGRGVLDDKGPIIAAVHALKAVVLSEKTLKRRVRIIFGCDEEVDCTDMERYMESEEIPVMAFTPDAEYPVIYSEKGIVYFTIKRKVCGLIEAEGGDAINQVPDKACIKIKCSCDDGVIKIKNKIGKVAHASTPEQGINAIDSLLSEVEGCKAYDDMDYTLKEFMDFYKRYFYGDISGTKIGWDFVSAELGSNTVNVGILFSEGDEIGIKVDCRIVPGFDIDKALEQLSKICSDEKMSLEITKRRDPLYMPKDDGLVKILNRVYNEVTGDELQPLSMGGGTYAKCLPNTVAFGPIFPWSDNSIHQANENISIDDLIKNVEIMSSAIYQMANH